MGFRVEIGLVLVLAFAFDDNSIGGDLDVYIVFRHPREIGAYYELAITLDNIDFREEWTSLGPGHGTPHSARQHAFKHTVHLIRKSTHHDEWRKRRPVV
jgi:hypothetical protein